MEKTYHVRTQQLKNPVGQNSVSSTPTKGRKEYWSVEGSIGMVLGSIGRGGIGMVQGGVLVSRGKYLHGTGEYWL